jgi:hypothetical protein
VIGGIGGRYGGVSGGNEGRIWKVKLSESVSLEAMSVCVKLAGHSAVGLGCVCKVCTVRARTQELSDLLIKAQRPERRVLVIVKASK